MQEVIGNPRPETRNPKPETRNPKSYIHGQAIKATKALAGDLKGDKTIAILGSKGEANPKPQTLDLNRKGHVAILQGMGEALLKPQPIPARVCKGVRRPGSLAPGPWVRAKFDRSRLDWLPASKQGLSAAGLGFS
jgi:hypothetical protein